jgi:hypothetical protein
MGKKHRRTASFICATAAVLLVGQLATTAAQAADCPKGSLGTSRILTVDAATYPRVGLKSFPQTLPLADHEVVLTFDDGPRPPSTQKVLAALARECVQATFFLVGRSAAQFPEIVKQIVAQGHTYAEKKERAFRQYHSRILKLPDDELHNQNMTGIEAT